VKSLVALLLPGAFFCCMAAMEDIRGKHPHIKVYGRPLPRWLLYPALFIGGPLWLLLFLAQSIRR
jgi:TRAP-type C4-dicarboxylate transport system permease small subunit